LFNKALIFAAFYTNGEDRAQQDPASRHIKTNAINIGKQKKEVQGSENEELGFMGI